MNMISSAINVNNWTQDCNLSMPNQWARYRQLSMSTRTKDCNLSMPNHWAQSQLVCFNKDQITSNTVIKAYLMLQVNVNRRNYKFYVIHMYSIV